MVRSRFDRVGAEVIRSTIRRLGKTCGAVLDALEAAGGNATVDELAAVLQRSRPRDLKRRQIARLEEAKVVECTGDTVSLSADWAAALEREREISGELHAERRDRDRYELARVGWRDELERRREERKAKARLKACRADGFTGDLQAVPYRPEPPPPPVPAQLEKVPVDTSNTKPAASGPPASLGWMP